MSHHATGICYSRTFYQLGYVTHARAMLGQLWSLPHRLPMCLPLPLRKGVVQIPVALHSIQHAAR